LGIQAGNVRYLFTPRTFSTQHIGAITPQCNIVDVMR
jgi:hypothetical protein